VLRFIWTANPPHYFELQDKLSLVTKATNMKTSLHPALRNLKAVMFDVGGTLIHPDWPRLGNLVETETGVRFTPEQMHCAFYAMLKVVDAELKVGVNSKSGRGAHWVFLDTFRSLGIDELKCLSIRERFAIAHDERHLWCVPDSEASIVLHTLQTAGLRTAVISNTEDGRVKESLALANLASYFEFVIDSHIVGCSKPDKAIFQFALDRFGLDAAEVAYVGDSYGYDVIGARQAGLYPVLLDRTDAYESEVGLTRIRRLSELIS
jgi:putative hydrolase of the HAD superfamily